MICSGERCFERNCLYLLLLCIIFFFFFFQAEDGIRDVAVTGVQTCALPICVRGEIQRRRGQLTDVDDRPARGHDSINQGVGQRFSGRPVVPADRYARALVPRLPAPQRHERLSNGARDFGRQLIAHGAANVVLAKDGGGELHGARPGSVARGGGPWRGDARGGGRRGGRRRGGPGGGSGEGGGAGGGEKGGGDRMRDPRAAEPPHAHTHER